MIESKKELIEKTYQLPFLKTTITKDQFIKRHLTQENKVLTFYHKESQLIESSNLQPTTIELSFTLEDSYVLLNAWIGNVLIYDYKYSFENLVGKLNTFIKDNKDIDTQLSPIIAHYFSLYNDFYKIHFDQLPILEKEGAKDVEDKIINSELSEGEYVLKKDDYYRYWFIADDSWSVDFTQLHKLTYIRNKGGNIFLERHNDSIDLSNMLKHLSSLATIDNETFVKALIALDFQFDESDQDKIDTFYKNFMENQSYLLNSYYLIKKEKDLSTNKR